MSVTVAEVMSRRVEVLDPSAACLTAWEFMRRTGSGHVAVVSHTGRVHGVVSLEDVAIAWCERGDPPFRETLGELLLGRLRPRVRDDAPVGLAARILLDSGFTALPVLDANRSLVGIVSERDVLAAVAGGRARMRALLGHTDAAAPASAGLAS
ncbi:CBS domain-containing protein [Jiangella rhizosphaerae]|uniref:CBS domain-containing protein n=1 Tax=Jiangella rhizosphaerae TaxID=2293569 RepID=A0A418KKX9_9ACTN|nr:CBS domain-containing protein [Jiangella rhizosphaerae]RIQ18235.1 CBS domain-containing protein [Jiangella rhizosphaerae]